MICDWVSITEILYSHILLPLLTIHRLVTKFYSLVFASPSVYEWEGQWGWAGPGPVCECKLRLAPRLIGHDSITYTETQQLNIISDQGNL